MSSPMQQQSGPTREKKSQRNERIRIGTRAILAAAVTVVLFAAFPPFTISPEGSVPSTGLFATISSAFRKTDGHSNTTLASEHVFDELNLQAKPSHLINPATYTLPKPLRAVLQFLFQCVVVFVVTNCVMEIAYFRHRWRMVVLTANLTCIASGVMFLSWPQQVYFTCICWSVNFGFVDPRIHIASLRRSPEALRYKILDFVIALGHHTSAAQVTGYIISGLMYERTHPAYVNSNIFDLNIFLLLPLVCEFLHKANDCAVLLRCAQPWFQHCAVLMMTVQAACFLWIIAFLDVQIPMFVMYSTVFCNALLVFRFGVMKVAPSTHEYLPNDCEPFTNQENQKAKRPRRRSIARLVYNQWIVAIKKGDIDMLSEQHGSISDTVPPTPTSCR